MIGIQITELKDFMGKFLMSDCFDSFLLEEAAITVAVSYRIDGRINRDFFTSEEIQNSSLEAIPFLPWSQIRPFCFDLIKGKRTPLNFKFVLHLMPGRLDALLSESSLAGNGGTELPPSKAMSVNAAVLTVKYDGAVIMLTTAISYADFVLDKTPDKLWDAYILKFLEQKGIKYILP